MKKRREAYNLKIEILKFAVIVLILIASCFAVYYFGFRIRSCDSQKCFSDSLGLCNKAKWINDNDEATWLYTINGIKDKKCEVNVKLLQAKKGKTDMEDVEGKEMNCYIPAGVLISPEQQNLQECHGLLKEDLQDLIIKRTHLYLLKNLGEINKEFFGLNSSF